MFDFNTLAEFSRANCVSICAFLVPANLIATSLTIILTGLHRPQFRVWQAAGIASIPALVMVYHVFTWFLVGVVMAPTYILLWLGTTCLLINLGAIAYRACSASRTDRATAAPARSLISRCWSYPSKSSHASAGYCTASGRATSSNIQRPCSSSTLM